VKNPEKTESYTKNKQVHGVNNKSHNNNSFTVKPQFVAHSPNLYKEQLIGHHHSSALGQTP
jgi:hypothetical protein